MLKWAVQYVQSLSTCEACQNLRQVKEPWSCLAFQTSLNRTITDCLAYTTPLPSLTQRTAVMKQPVQALRQIILA